MLYKNREKDKFLKCIWNDKRTQRAQEMLTIKKKEPYFLIKLYEKTVVVKRIWRWHKNRPVDPWNRIERPEINPTLCGQLRVD